MSSLYAYNFTLLPRPQRSVFSLGNEVTRATLPDFADVQQLSDFVRRLHVWRFDVPSTFAQCKFAAVFIGVLLLTIILILGRRMFEKSFWLVRIIKKPSGRLLVPNAMLAFTSIQGVFATVFIAFLWLYCRWFQHRDTQYAPNNPILWLGMTWCPLIWGAMWAAWGTHFATPSSEQLHVDTRRTRSCVQTFFSHAITINALGLLSPVAVVVTVVGPATISSTGYMRGLRMGEEWQAMYADQEFFSQAMVQDAQQVWFQATRSMWMANVCFICWTFYAFATAVIYAIISMRLLAAIRGELEKREEATVRVMDILTMHALAKNDSEDEERGDGGGVDRATVSIAKDRHGSDTTAVDDTAGCGIAKVSQIGETPVVSLRTEDILRSAGWRRFVPNIVRQQGVDASTTESRSKQMRDLRKAFVHLCIQFAAIVPACVVMGCLALTLAVTMTGATEQPSATGGTQFEYVFNVVLLIIIWCICPAGSVTLFAIAQRTYEPVLAFGGGSRGNVTSGGGGGSGSSGASKDIGSHAKGNIANGIARILGCRQPLARSAPVNHAMSTFFETHTHVRRTTVTRSGRSHSQSSQQALNESYGSPTSDVERGSMHFGNPILPPLSTQQSNRSATKPDKVLRLQASSRDDILASTWSASTAPPPLPSVRPTRVTPNIVQGSEVQPHPFNVAYRNDKLC